MSAIMDIVLILTMLFYIAFIIRYLIIGNQFNKEIEEIIKAEEESEEEGGRLKCPERKRVK